MARAQTWVQGQMKTMGLVNVAAEPFMDFGVTWDNEYVSIHPLEPDYQPMVGYPVAHTGSTDHVAFDEVGLPGFQFLQDNIPGTGGHTNLDFLEAIQPSDLMKNAVIMASFAYHAANADARIPRKTVR